MPTTIGGGHQHRKHSADDAIFNDPAVAGVPREWVEAFLQAWSIYPMRAGGNPRRMALKAFIARVKSRQATCEELITATDNYKAYCVKAGAEGTPYVLHGATFYGPNERWMEYRTRDEGKPMPEDDDMAREIRETWMRGGKPI